MIKLVVSILVVLVPSYYAQAKTGNCIVEAVGQLRPPFASSGLIGQAVDFAALVVDRSFKTVQQEAESYANCFEIGQKLSQEIGSVIQVTRFVYNPIDGGNDQLQRMRLNSVQVFYLDPSGEKISTLFSR